MTDAHSYRPTFARTLAAWQNKAPGTLDDLMVHMGVSRTTVVGWLSGEKMPGLARIVRLATYFDRDPEQALLDIATESLRDDRLDNMGLRPGQDVLDAVLAHDLAANWSNGTGWWQ
ncbi:helix-turn-helix domain-containing protein [Lentzea sp. JNUCC 0626]|uniref:helix-turn-helix domain-containing protein n=1 Tax=Lentzea sp. JNUCC 0626 TaxID=3367513 RepID=UPI003749A9AF